MLSGPNQRNMKQIWMQLGQIIMMNGTSMQSIHIAKIRSQLAKPKVVAFMGTIGCKKYPKAACNSEKGAAAAGKTTVQTTRHQAHQKTV